MGWYGPNDYLPMVFCWVLWAAVTTLTSQLDFDEVVVSKIFVHFHPDPWGDDPINLTSTF